MDYLLVRTDFWPYHYEDEKIEYLRNLQDANIELNRVFDLYEMIDNFGKPPVKAAIKIVEEEKVDITAKNKGVVRKPKPTKEKIVM